MPVSLEAAITLTEHLLAQLRELDEAMVDDQAHGRAARHERARISLRLQRLAHEADSIRLELVGVQLDFREGPGAD